MGRVLRSGAAVTAADPNAAAAAIKLKKAPLVTKVKVKAGGGSAKKAKTGESGKKKAVAAAKSRKGPKLLDDGHLLADEDEDEDEYDSSNSNSDVEEDDVADMTTDSAQPSKGKGNKSKLALKSDVLISKSAAATTTTSSVVPDQAVSEGGEGKAKARGRPKKASTANNDNALSASSSDLSTKDMVVSSSQDIRVVLGVDNSNNNSNSNNASNSDNSDKIMTEAALVSYVTVETSTTAANLVVTDAVPRSAAEKMDVAAPNGVPEVISVTTPIMTQQMCQSIFVSDEKAIKVLMSLGFGVKQLTRVSVSTMELDEDFNAVKKINFLHNNNSSSSSSSSSSGNSNSNNNSSNNDGSMTTGSSSNVGTVPVNHSFPAPAPSCATGAVSFHPSTYSSLIPNSNPLAPSSSNTTAVGGNAYGFDEGLVNELLQIDSFIDTEKSVLGANPNSATFMNTSSDTSTSSSSKNNSNVNIDIGSSDQVKASPVVELPLHQPLLLADEEAFYLALRGIILVEKVQAVGNDESDIISSNSSSNDNNNNNNSSSSSSSSSSKSSSSKSKSNTVKSSSKKPSLPPKPVYYSMQELWAIFCTKTPLFPSKYKTYEYFKSKGYVVKGGINYGVDFTVYRTLPVWCHSEICVIVIAADDNVEEEEDIYEDDDVDNDNEESDDDEDEDEDAEGEEGEGEENGIVERKVKIASVDLEVGESKMSWRHLSSLTRITPDVMKLFVLAYVSVDDDVVAAGDFDPTQYESSTLDKLNIKLIAMNNRRKNCLNEKYQSLKDIHDKYQKISLLKKPRKVKVANPDPKPKPPKPLPPPTPNPDASSNMNFESDPTNTLNSVTANATPNSTSKPNSNNVTSTNNSKPNNNNHKPKTGPSTVGGRRDIFEVRTKGSSKNNKLWKSLLENGEKQQLQQGGNKRNRDSRDEGDNAHNDNNGEGHSNNSSSNSGSLKVGNKSNNKSNSNDSNKKAKVIVETHSNSSSTPAASSAAVKPSQNKNAEQLVNSAKAAMAAAKAKLEVQRREKEEKLEAQRLLEAQKSPEPLSSATSLAPAFQTAQQQREEQLVNSAKAAIALAKAKLETQKREKEAKELQELGLQALSGLPESS